MKKNVMRIAALLLLLSLLLSLTACGENAKRKRSTPTARPPMPTM